MGVPRHLKGPGAELSLWAGCGAEAFGHSSPAHHVQFPGGLGEGDRKGWVCFLYSNKKYVLENRLFFLLQGLSFLPTQILQEAGSLKYTYFS